MRGSQTEKEGGSVDAVEEELLEEEAAAAELSDG